MRALAFTPDAKTLVGGDTTGVLSRWDLATGQRTWTQQVDEGREVPVGVLSLECLPDGNRVAIGGGELGLWDLSKDRRVWSVKNDRPVRVLRASPDGRTLAYVVSAGVIRLLDADTGAPRATLQANGAEVTCLGFSPDGKALASGSVDKSITVWDLALGKVSWTVQAHKADVVEVAFLAGAGRLVSGGRDGQLHLWGLSQPNPIKSVQAHPRPLSLLKVTGDGSTVVTCGEDGSMRTWNGKTLEARATVAEGFGSVPESLAVNSDGSLVAAGLPGGPKGPRVLIWDAR